MRPIDARVSNILRLSPSCVRFTFAGKSLRRFEPTGLDQRINLMVPLKDGSFTDVGLFDESPPEVLSWHTTWRQLPDELRNPICTYTVRHIRAAQEEIDVDFVLHDVDDDAEAPAARWAAGASVGDRLIVLGPEARAQSGDFEAAGSGHGVEWAPGQATELLIVADETAVPAAVAILESLGPHCSGEAFLEVPMASDVLDVRTESSVQIRWLPREGETWGDQLDPAVRDWGRRRAAAMRAPSTQELPELPTFEGDILLWELAEANGAPTAEGSGHYAWLAGGGRGDHHAAASPGAGSWY